MVAEERGNAHRSYPMVTLTRSDARDGLMIVVITLSGQRFRARSMADALEIAAALSRIGKLATVTGPWKRSHR